MTQVPAEPLTANNTRRQTTSSALQGTVRRAAEDHSNCSSCFKMAATSNIHNLTTLIKRSVAALAPAPPRGNLRTKRYPMLTDARLEAATSRLEDIATSTDITKDLPALRQDESRSAGTGVPLAKSVSSEPIPETIEEFDRLIASSVDKFVKLSEELGSSVAKQVRRHPKL